LTRFKDLLISGEVDTLVSVKNEQIGCVYGGIPINFDNLKMNPPSQDMIPVQVYTTGMMGWRSSKFISNFEEFNSAYHGGSGETRYFELSGFSTIDIDNEEDFILAEAVAQFIPFIDKYNPMYYSPSKIDYIVPNVMRDDGVNHDSTSVQNQVVVNIPEILDLNPKTKSWYKTLINTESNSCTIVNQMPGEGNRLHYHAKWNEWWYILQGEWRFDIDGTSYLVSSGDLVFIEKGKKHKITAVGDSLASRLAVSRYDVEHIYEKN
jgi:mannose-6-phosphate isomerase-like protein (cupin superfamily)